MIGAVSRAVITFVTQTLFIGRVDGIENLPKQGPYVIVANHASFMDHFIIAAILRFQRKERVYYLTKKESFEKLFSRIWHLSVGCIPLNRNAADTAAFRAVLRYLSEGKIVCIYPEGTRSSTGKMLPGKSGAVKMALLANVPIVPIGMERTFDILPKKRMIPRLIRAVVRIGEPIQFEKSQRKQDMEAVTQEVMGTIAQLCNETGNDYKKSSEDIADSIDPIVQMLEAAKEWNEIGIRKSFSFPLPPEILFHRAKYIAEEILKLEPNHADAHFELGRAIGRLALLSHPVKKLLLAHQSRREFETAIGLDPNHAHAHYALGMWHLSIPKLFGGDKKLALEEYQLAVQLDPQEIFLYMGLGQCQIRLQMFEEARTTFLRALEVPSVHPEDHRRKLEAMTQILRIDPQTKFEERLIHPCLIGLQNG